MPGFWEKDELVDPPRQKGRGFWENDQVIEIPTKPVNRKANPFDQFDPPPKQAANVFDQFDKPIPADAFDPAEFERFKAGTPQRSRPKGADLSGVSDADLLASLGRGSARRPSSDLSQVSDADLLASLGSAQPTGGFDPAEFAAFKAPAPVGDPLKALQPFYEKGVSTRNSAGQFTDEARAVLTREGINPASIDQKAERELLAQYQGKIAPTGSDAAAVGRGLINGVPVIGPALLGGTNKAAAFIRAVQNGTSYTDELRNVEAFEANTARGNPGTTTWSEAIGGVLGTAPLIAAAPAAFGAGTAGLVTRSRLSAASGALLGGSDAAVRSDGDVGEAVTGGALGGGLGLIAPGVGHIAGRGVNAVVSGLATRNARIPGAGNRTANQLVDDVRNSGGIEPVRARLDELGSEAMLLDASPSFTGRAQGLAVRPETREAVTAPLVARDQGTNARIARGLDEALGEAPVPSQIEAQFAAKRAASGDMFERALSQETAVDTSGALAEIGQRLNTAAGAEKAALLRARELLVEQGEAGAVPRSDPRYLHNAKGALDDLIEYGDPTIGVARGSLSRDEGALAAVRNRLNGALEAQIDGYADANLAYRTATRASQALESGRKVLGGGDAAIHPYDFATDLARRPIEQQAALRAGVRADLDRAVGSNANDLAALRREVLAEGDWNRQKLNATFGDEAVDDVARSIDSNTAFRENYGTITKNSQAEQRRQAADGVAVRDILPKGEGVGITIAGAVGGPAAVATALGLKGARIAANAVGKASDLARNRETASILTMRAGAERDALIEALQARIAAATRGEAPANEMDRFVRLALQSQGDRSRRNLPSDVRGQ